MLNIFGIVLSFLGTVFTLALLIFSKSDKTFSYDDMKNLGESQYKNKRYSMIGLFLITIGFCIQIYVAIQNI